jgi:hypothetical protein
VPIQRSAIAFARGARPGVRMMAMSTPANTASKAAVNSASRSRIKNQVGHRRVCELQHVEAAEVRRDRFTHPEAASSRCDAA